MSKTGASDAQIEAIAEREWNEHMSKPWGDADLLLREVVMAKYRVEARHICPPTHRIVAVDDLTALLDEIAYWAPMEGCRSESIAALDRVSALIGGE